VNKVNKNLLLENNINKNHLNNSPNIFEKLRLKKIIKNIYNNLDNEKNTYHFLSKKFILDFEKSSLKKFKKYELIVLIGMGGSVLGAKAIYSFLKEKIKKNFIFIDNLDYLKIEQLKKNKYFKNCLFIIISKSGNTIETLVNSSLLKNKITFKNTIIITEKKK
jgi:glucose-6-phosphate isomerase